MKGNDPSAHARYLALLRVFRSADTMWQASRMFFTRWQLSPSQFNVLNLLGDQPEGLSQSELGRRLITHRSNVTGLVDRLEQRGLVKRHNVAGDRRAYRVVLTTKGRRLWEVIVPDYHDAASRIWGGLAATRATRLAGDLEVLARNAEGMTAGQSE